MDLKGKTVVFGGGRGAMMAYITATYLLRQAGLKKGDYFEQFALNPPKACIATFYRKATAAGAGNYVLDLPHVKKQIDVDEMKYLSVSEKMAHLPWAVSNSVDPKTEQQLQTILVHLNGTKTGREVLKKAKITRFKSASDTDYDLHREIIKSVLGEEY
jgi:phosphonate transport system substrate-binding protein